ncbi:hypothetical protein LOK49_LG08G01671 [Camellia lanceoleosa]|uniref:Uncharacterized protein n=1 Tax=Camellia lanceoleosa TaxID=1840588 RepID=A0ACC0GY73_9ERIC|nr:hypothetical protein LOK49_LG08G01671 [Camellia lanceoleosa]
MTKQLMGSQGHEIAAKMDSYMRGMVGGSGASLFEELGLYYIGPMDGHNVEDLVHILKDVKSLPIPAPVLIHILTEKGKGYAPVEVAADKMHDNRGLNCRPISKDSLIKIGQLVKVMLDWTDKEHKLYDSSYLKDVPEVYKTKLTVKKTRQEVISLFSCLDAFLKEEPLGPNDMW